jgi:cytochrome P450
MCVAAGKRSCLGENLARQEVFIALAGLLQQFDIRPPEGHERIDVRHAVSIVVGPTPFEVCLVARQA